MHLLGVGTQKHPESNLGHYTETVKTADFKKFLQLYFKHIE